MVARFGLLFLRDGLWDGRRILPEGLADYVRTPRAVSNGLYGAHCWTIPGSLGTFECHGAFGQRTTICPKLDLIVVRLGETAPAKVGSVVAFNKAIVDAFRPTVDYAATPPHRSVGSKLFRSESMTVAAGATTRGSVG